MSNIVELTRNLSAEDAALFSLIAESGWTVILEAGEFVWRNYDVGGYRGPFATEAEALTAAHQIQQELKGQTRDEEPTSDNEQLTTVDGQLPSDAGESPFDAAITIGERHRRTSDEVTLKARLLELLAEHGLNPRHDVPCPSGVIDVATDNAIYEIVCSLNLLTLPTYQEKLDRFYQDALDAKLIGVGDDAIIVTCCAEDLSALKARAEDVAVMTFAELASHYHEKGERTQNVLSDGEKVEIIGQPASTAPEVLLLNVDLLRTDGGTQTRTQLNLLKMAEYAELMREGVPFPPCDVFYDGQDYWVADGFHRVGATKQAELEEINVLVHQGTRRDAVLFSVGANASHGIPRTNDDKRRAVMILFKDEEWQQWSDSRIAKAAGVSQPFVSGIRRELIGQNVLPEQSVRKTSAGRVMDTAGISARDDEQETTQQILPGAEAALDAADDSAPLGTSEVAGSTASNEEPNQATEGTGESSLPEAYFGVTMRNAGWMMRREGELYRADNDTLKISRPTFKLAQEAVDDAATFQDNHEAQQKAQAQARLAQPAEKKPSVEELLGNQKMVISYVWIPGLKDKISVSVNVGNDPTTARRAVVSAENLRPLPEEIMKLVAEQIAAAEPQKKASGKQTEPKTQAPAQQKPAARRASKKAAQKSPAKTRSKSPSKKAGAKA